MLPDLNKRNTLIYARDDVIFVFRRNLYAKPHAHHALQLTIPLTNSCHVTVNEEQFTTAGIIIDQECVHLVAGQTDWVGTLLINPETAVAQAYRQRYLTDQAYTNLGNDSTNQLRSLLASLCNTIVSCIQLEEVFGEITAVLHLNPLPTSNIDPRIQEALAIAKQQEEYKIPAQALADSLALSPSRMAHLFKEDVGIPLRRYLLWQRLLVGLQAASTSASLTDAAHAAGFTDLAHFSHTCNTMFGFWPSAMFTQQANQDAHVVLCEQPDF